MITLFTTPASNSAVPKTMDDILFNDEIIHWFLGQCIMQKNTFSDIAEGKTIKIAYISCFITNFCCFFA
jgi:hypothetical protein